MRLRFRFALVLLFAAAPAAATTLQDGNRLYFSGQPDRALDAYRAVLHRRPSPDAALNAATVAQELGRHKEAIALLELARKSGATSPDLLGQLAWAYYNEGQIAAALRTFALYNEAGGEATPYMRLGRALAEMDGGHTAKAKELLKSLAADAPKFAPAQYFKGLVLERDGQFDAALDAYDAAVTIDSHFLEARPRMAVLYENMKRPDDAWRQYVRISYADEDNTAADAGMARLASRITKKPQEIVPPRRILEHTRIPPVPGAASLPVVRIGIGTSSWGEPTGKKTVAFRASNGFVALNPRTGAVLAKGRAVKPWTIHINAHGRAEIATSTGGVVATFADKVLLKLADRDTGTFIVNTLVFAPGTAWGGMSDREFRGDLEITLEKKAKRLVIVNILSVEEYLYGVLAAEMPVGYPLEALKAQAVMARNIALYRSRVLKLHKKHGYDLCDGQHCQVYTGVSVESEKVRAAVDATRGRVLLYDGNLCHTVFSSNCGGVTESGPEAGWGNEPYWKSVSDARPGTETPSSPWEWRRWVVHQADVYCKGSQYVSSSEYRWTRVVPAETIAAKLKKKKNVGRVRQIYITKRARSGRVQRVRILGTKGEVILTKEDQIRHYLGLGSLRSNLFSVDTVVRNERAERFVFHGAGWGHGVGFCQTGSAGRAEDGASYEEILAAYFPGTVLR